MQSLISKINSKSAKVAVIGLGYVGLPLACTLSESGFVVTGIDLDKTRVDLLNSGKSYISDIPDTTISNISKGTGKNTPLFKATTQYEPINCVDAVIICVPTPLRNTKEPDISYIVSVTEQISQRITPNTLVILESTTYPGTTTEILQKSILSGNPSLKIGDDLFIAFSPERIDPGRTDYTIKNTPKVVGGSTPACSKLASALYEKITETVIAVSKPEVAEMVKLLENTFRLTNIALVNEIAMMCDRMDIDVWEVIDAASTKPFGFMPFKPGPGLGGHCIPIDPHYLAWKMQTLNYNARFIELATAINYEMPEYVLSKIINALNEKGKAISKSKIMILGASYKANISDTRESPALDIIHLLENKSAVVEYNDPYVNKIHIGDKEIYSKPISKITLKHYDCVVIITDHDIYDWELVVNSSKLIIDTRNATRNLTYKSSNIVKI